MRKLRTLANTLQGPTKHVVVILEKPMGYHNGIKDKLRIYSERQKLLPVPGGEVVGELEEQTLAQFRVFLEKYN